MALEHRLPAFSPQGPFPGEGGLMSYSAHQEAMHREAASYVDRILKGARPADLPVQQPTKFELVINLKIARELGVKIPQTVLLRADRVIE
jgi:putative ABC transport system substrate-binding protein